MNITQRLTAAIGALRGKGLTTNEHWQVLYGGGSVGSLSREEMLQRYTSWVYACVDIRAKSVAAARFRLYKRVGVDEYEEIEDHPLYEILNRPNPWDTKYEFLYRSVTHLDLTGDAYWNIASNGFGLPAELWLLPTERMKILPSEVNFISGYEMQTVKGKIPFSVDEVVHMKYPSPSNPYYGIGPLQAAQVAVGVSDFQGTFQTRLFKNSAIPPLVLTTDKAMTEPNKRYLSETWHELYGGSNTGKTPVLDNGLKIQPVGVNPKDLDWLSNNRTTRDEILAIFGVPASKLGLVEDVNKASAVVMDYTLAVNVVEPILRLIDEKLTQEIAHRFDPKLVVIHDSTVPKDRTEEAATMEKRLGVGMTTRNEERKLLGYKEIDGGDKLLVPLNYADILTIDEVQNGKGAV